MDMGNVLLSYSFIVLLNVTYQLTRHLENKLLRYKSTEKQHAYISKTLKNLQDRGMRLSIDEKRITFFTPHFASQTSWNNISHWQNNHSNFALFKETEQQFESIVIIPKNNDSMQLENTLREKLDAPSKTSNKAIVINHPIPPPSYITPELKKTVDKKTFSMLKKNIRCGLTIA